MITYSYFRNPYFNDIWYGMTVIGRGLFSMNIIENYSTIFSCISGVLNQFLNFSFSFGQKSFSKFFTYDGPFLSKKLLLSEKILLNHKFDHTFLQMLIFLFHFKEKGMSFLSFYNFIQYNNAELFEFINGVYAFCLYVLCMVLPMTMHSNLSVFSTRGIQIIFCQIVERPSDFVREKESEGRPRIVRTLDI